MKLLTAIIIFSGDPALVHQMKDAVKTIRKEQIRSDAFLCQETVKALLRLKKK